MYPDSLSGDCKLRCPNRTARRGQGDDHAGYPGVDAPGPLVRAPNRIVAVLDPADGGGVVPATSLGSPPARRVKAMG